MNKSHSDRNMRTHIRRQPVSERKKEPRERRAHLAEKYNKLHRCKQIRSPDRF